jgi:choice-of-anchor B domain-containing protein
MKKNYLIGLLILTIQFVNAQNFNMELVGQLNYSPKLNDVWGYVDSLGNEYALVGTHTPGGVSVVDLSDPANPVEVAFVEDANSLWRDMKTWGTHAYATNENAQGMLIIDLSSLPDASGITSTRYTGPVGSSWSSAHNLFIDEFGFAYIFGANRGNGGAIILDLSDPENPVEVGTYETAYIHDGMVKNNILYTGNIYLGTFSVVDVSDKSNPVYLGGHETPSEFTHNTWVSDDGNYVYTTDEVSGGYIAGYDISDLNDIVETDKARVAPNTSITVHNTHFMNEYVITSYYDAGVTIHDVSDPENMVMTGHYDTAPNNSSGFGAWGAYPFLPSGLVLASDNAEGLFVLQPIYTRAARIEGQITDALTGDAIFNADVSILNTDAVDISDVTGEYKMGVAEAGMYSVKIIKSDYADTIITNIELINGETLQLDVALNNGTVGINELYSGADFKVYPNPATDKLYIEIDNKTNGVLKEIYLVDLSGKRVYTQKVSTRSGRITIDHNLDNGTYILNLLWADQRISVNKVLIAE